MAVEQPIGCPAPVPDPSRVRQLASEMRQTLKAARERLRGEANELQAQRDSVNAERQHLVRSRAELRELRDQIEGKLAEIATAAKGLEQQRAEIESLCKESADEGVTLAALWQDFETKPETLRKDIPKPAASGAADQFRKLRRDAKRRAIGV